MTGASVDPLARPRISIGAAGLDPEEAMKRLQALLASDADPGERLAAIDSYRLRIPLEQGPQDEALFDAYRRMLRLWNVAEQPPIASHRPIVGPVLVRAKRLVRRVLAFELEPMLERQASFNHAAVAIIRFLLAEIGRLRRRVRELEDGRP